MIKTNIELASAAEKAAKFSKTLYVLGCFGAPMNASNKNRYTNNLDFNKQDARKNKILQASADTFGFDCVCFIKGLLWGWEGNTSHQYGGATYQSNGVPDISANSMIKACKDVSTDFSNIQVGEAVWMDGHIGLFIGDGLAVECTHRWKDGVQITAVHNIGQKSGYNGRAWTKHGKLPYIEYTVAKPVVPEAPATPATPVVTEKPAENLSMTVEKAIEVLALEVIDGKFGNGEIRKEKLYRTIQNKVNELLKG